MMPRNHAATPQVLDPREKRQTIKSALYQQKEFLTVPWVLHKRPPRLPKQLLTIPLGAAETISALAKSLKFPL